MKSNKSELKFEKAFEGGNQLPHRAEGNLDLSGSMTITGNLTVQQSNWVYLRGPITSSRILVNGPITASGLMIKERDGVEGESIHFVTNNDLETLKRRLDKLERKFTEWINSHPQKP